MTTSKRKLDLYLSNLEKFGASGVRLEGGSSVVFHFPAGDRHANQTTSNEFLMKLVSETAPAEVAGELAAGSESSFTYQYAGTAYRVEIDPTPNRWRIQVAPGAGDPEPSPAPAGPEPVPLPPEPGPPSAGPPFTSPPDPEPGPAIAPPAAEGTGAIDVLLRQMAELGASDLHLSTGCRPYVRLHGGMKMLDSQPVHTAESLWTELRDLMPERNRSEFESRNDTDFAYAIEGLSRFRVNVFRDRRGPCAVIRAIPYEILSAEQLGLPRGVLDLCQASKGLVLVTGPTGSGKSTTLATLIDYVNRQRTDHIITIEDPIEFVHENKKCLVHQREVREHTDSFKDALRAALREDPDIVLVGEMRDLETIAIAVETAETGHLVFGTLHTTTAPSTVDRIIDQFPGDRQEQIRQMLSESLAGVVAQTLCRKKGGGRIAAYEILIANSAVRNLVRERKTFQLFSLMQTGSAQGMRTMNMSLLELVKSGQVDPTEAYMKAVNKGELLTMLQREGFSVKGAGE